MKTRWLGEERHQKHIGKKSTKYKEAPVSPAQQGHGKPPRLFLCLLRRRSDVRETPENLRGFRAGLLSLLGPRAAGLPPFVDKSLM